MRRSAIRVFVGTINAIRRVQRCIEGCPRLTLFADNRISVVVLDRHTNRGRVDVAVAENEESTEDGLSDAIEDTVKDCLRVRGDDVTRDNDKFSIYSYMSLHHVELHNVHSTDHTFYQGDTKAYSNMLVCWSIPRISTHVVPATGSLFVPIVIVT